MVPTGRVFGIGYTLRKCVGNSSPGNIKSNVGDCWPMAEHVGIGCIRQGAVTLASFDAPAQFVGFGRAPGRAKIVVVVAQVSNGLRADTAGPYITIRGNLGRGNPCQARDHLAFFDQRALDNVIVSFTERLGNTRNAIKLSLANTLL